MVIGQKIASLATENYGGSYERRNQWLSKRSSRFNSHMGDGNGSTTRSLWKGEKRNWIASNLFQSLQSTHRTLGSLALLPTKASAYGVAGEAFNMAGQAALKTTSAWYKV